ncbi:hypothetical protein ACQPTN_32885 [Bradyrhizobium sp. 13971]
MNQHAKVDIRHSTCPHDRPSACALDVQVIEGRSIGRVRGSKQQTHTAGVVCAKGWRVTPSGFITPSWLDGPAAPDRAEGLGEFARISWDEALE